MAISAAGLGSGLDVNAIVSQLMGLERQPLTALDRKEAVFQAKISAYGNIKSTLSSFQTAVRGISDISKFQVFKATSADTTLYTATATSTATAGSYGVEVVRLAKAHKLTTAGQASSTATIGAGTATTLTFDFGTVGGGTLGGDGKYTGVSRTFDLNPLKSTKTVTVNNTNNTLEGVRNAINNANIGVTATILNDGGAGTPYRLVLTSSDTGAANSLRVAVSGDATVQGLLAYDSTATQNLAQTDTALHAGSNDAQIKVDGFTVTKASNTITDVIAGVTLNLVKAGVATTLTVARDTAAVKGAVESFVKAYNDIQKTITGLTAYNASTKQGAILQGDYSAVGVLSQIRGKLNSAIQYSGGTLTLLSQVGISFQKDGSLTLDSTKLDTAITNNFNDIAKLFAAVGAPTDSLVSFASATANTKPGSYAVNVTTLATRGAYTGAATAAFPLTVDANNDNFAIKIDGVTSATLALAQGSYATAADLAAQIQARINGDSALAAAGVSVNMIHNGTAFVVTSNNYGSASKVEFTGIDPNTATTLGFNIGAGTTGLDAAGSINGVAASAAGQYLTGITGDNAEGLKVQIIGGVTGDRGTLNYSQGYAYQLDKLADILLGTSGPVASRTDGITKSIKDIGNQRDVLNRRLTDFEQSLREKFTRLDTAISKLKSTSDFVSRQLAQLVK
ncbi:MAG: flagellar filament capping protein FliD [Gammaproteobacteria bacterium]|nr:flagellar filament capping protein FliD [Gammaproteobacteria bacterium]